MNRRAALWLAGAVLALAASIVIAPCVGAGDLSVVKAWRGESPDREIILELRLSRALLAAMTGAALGLAGSLFQAMLRNALATPYTLGVSSGASLGAVAAICMGWQSWHGIPMVWIAALGGAALVLLAVLTLALRTKQMSSLSLLLLGICANSACSALIVLMHSFAGFSQSFSITRWLIGGIDATDFTTLGILAAVLLPTSWLILSQAKQWNLIYVGEDWAASRGVPVRRRMLTGYLAGSILTAAVTALTGPIGFVGLIVPHLLRRPSGGDNRLLMPLSFLLGGVLLCWCDTLGRSILPPSDIPAGVITALLGGAFLAAMVRSAAAKGEF